jgi:ABC-type transport system involved in multi-copper enzyme maturation permease subunit
MSTATATLGAASPARPPALATQNRVTFPRVVRSEWIKFRTLRSSWLTLFATVAALIVVGLLIGYHTGQEFAHLAPEDVAPSGVMQGYYLGQLLIGVLGVLFVSGEYTTGMIRSSLAAVPKRLPVLTAKAVVFAAVALVTLVPTAFVTFLGGQRILSHYGHGWSLSDPGVLRVVIGTGVYLALIGLLGGAFGWIVRSTPGAISTLIGLLLVVPTIFRVLPGAWVKTAFQYLPGQAGSAFASSLRASDALAPWTGLLVLVIWVVAALGVAAIVLKRRDG